jgi:hypothetical protein
MSRYSDKKRQPGCRVTDCRAPAVVLAIRHGVLGWYCQGHKNQ